MDIWKKKKDNMVEGEKKNDGHGEKAMARKRENNGQGESVSTKGKRE